VCFKYREQLGNHEQVLNLFGEIQKLQLSALIVGRRIRANKLPDAGAIHIRDISEVEQYLLFAFVQEFAYRLAQLYASLADGYFTRKVEDSYVACLPVLDIKLSHLDFSFLYSEIFILMIAFVLSTARCCRLRDGWSIRLHP